VQDVDAFGVMVKSVASKSAALNSSVAQDGLQLLAAADDARRCVVPFHSLESCQPWAQNEAEWSTVEFCALYRNVRDVLVRTSICADALAFPPEFEINLSCPTQLDTALLAAVSV
jgi:hypothetical protein